MPTKKDPAYKTSVYKFGGTSVGTAEAIRRVASIVSSFEDGRLVLVLSAMGGVTDKLLLACQMASNGDGAALEGELKGILTRHIKTLEDLLPENEHAACRQELEREFGQVVRLLRASCALREVTPKARDAILASGEKLSVRLVSAYFAKIGVAAQVVDADTFLDTDSNYGAAEPLVGVYEKRVSATLERLFEVKCLPVVTGFCGRAPDGSTTTLGRGGSDLSATLLGAALNAEKVVLWSDVDGVFTANPGLISTSRPIQQLHYREAAEMSFYGAKVIHQRSMAPVAERGIPVYARNTFNPEAPGTTIDGSVTHGSHPVKAVTAVEGQALVSIEGKGMAGRPGLSSKVFAGLASEGINVSFISQSSSEATLTIAIAEVEGVAALQALRQVLSVEIAQGAVEDIKMKHPVSLVAAVGLGMANQPGIAARLFTAIAREAINVVAIAQGASELNISLAVDHEQTEAAVRTIHEEFGLAQRDSGVDVGRHFDVLLVGCGNIGRRFLELLKDRTDHIKEEYNLDTRVVGICDRSAFCFDPIGFSEATRTLLIDHKASGERFESLDFSNAGDANRMVLHASDYRLARPVLVDVSNDSSADTLFSQAFAAGMDIVTANKAPLSGEFEIYEQMVGPANHERLLRAESTVGAGLPVLDTIQMLRATGDRVHRIEGCLSGTLGYVCDRLEQGERLSSIVREAQENGYTEPDPALDLSGVDVGRKALILARISNLARKAAFPEIEGFVPSDWIGLETADFYQRLQKLDDIFAFRATQANQAGECLRFLVTIARDDVRVGLRSISKSAPLGTLKGTDNRVVFYTERYAEQPLVVSGPGAGVDVTAMGVLSDLMRVAMHRT